MGGAPLFLCGLLVSCLCRRAFFFSKKNNKKKKKKKKKLETVSLDCLSSVDVSEVC
jgi:hypothetical protein